MKKPIFPLEYKELEPPIIFLAGPIAGAPDWQVEAIDMINRQAPEIQIASPRIKAGLDLAQVVDWETAHLRKAAYQGCILFWLAKERTRVRNRAYAQTSRFELGQYLEKGKVVVGMEDGFFGQGHLGCRLPQVGKIQYKTLEETVSAAITKARQHKRFFYGIPASEYIGLTGVGIDEIDELAAGLESLGLTRGSAAGKVASINLLTSTKMTYDNYEKKGFDQKVTKTELWDILDRYADRFMISIHHSHLGRDYGIDELQMLINGSSGKPYAVQVNDLYPGAEFVEDFREVYPDIPLILQLREEFNDEEKITQYLDCYNSFASLVLIDGSIGYGKLISDDAPDRIRILNKAYPDLAVGIAGGLSPSNVAQKLRWIRGEVPGPVSIDAQKMLRTGGRFDVNKALAYAAIAKEN